jgi:hypothetical protein
MSYRAVAGHTPDVCWVGNGWQMEAHGQIDQWAGKQAEIPTAETRIFQTENTKETVIFWHLVGREVISYGLAAPPPWYAVFLDLWRNGLNQRQEQFFVRLSSPLALNSPDLRSLMDPLIDTVTELVEATPGTIH